MLSAYLRPPPKRHRGRLEAPCPSALYQVLLSFALISFSFSFSFLASQIYKERILLHFPFSFLSNDIVIFLFYGLSEMNIWCSLHVELHHRILPPNDILLSSSLELLLIRQIVWYPLDKGIRFPLFQHYQCKSLPASIYRCSTSFHSLKEYPASRPLACPQGLTRFAATAPHSLSGSQHTEHYSPHRISLLVSLT